MIKKLNNRKLINIKSVKDNTVTCPDNKITPTTTEHLISFTC